MLKGFTRPRYIAALVAAVLFVLPLALHADEGFWPFNRIPKAAIKQAYGVELSDAWLTRVQQASVRFPSGSGSFVSPDGLVLTNHHVAMEIIQELSTAQTDYVKSGFTARDRAQELKAPDLELLVLQTIEDVTARVNADIKPGMSSAETLAARRAAIARSKRKPRRRPACRAKWSRSIRARSITSISTRSTTTCASCSRPSSTSHSSAAIPTTSSIRASVST